METASIKVYGIVQHNGRVLLEKDLVGKPGWKCVGGHKEDSETLTEALVREGKEEVGLDVTVGELLATKDFYRPSERNTYHIRIFFECNAAGDTLTPQKDEIAEARWFTLDELRSMADGEFYVDHLQAIRRFLGKR